MIKVNLWICHVKKHTYPGVEESSHSDLPNKEAKGKTKDQEEQDIIIVLLCNTTVEERKAVCIQQKNELGSKFQDS